ncbi:MAG: PAS domain-containing protein [Planctomycetales bacterium]|nr:PAS domain-containing protein [Planctomycetales bacterium]
MTKKRARDNCTWTGNLRRRAEELLSVNPDDMPTVGIADVQAIIHELTVHQIELELQNEELRKSQIALAEARDRYADLYDFAPVGYMTLDRQGVILQANLTAATLLDSCRNEMIGSPFSRFLSRDDADRLYLHLAHSQESDRTHSCDLQLVNQGERLRYVRLESTRDRSSKLSPQWRATLSDVTELILARDATERSQRLAALGTMAAGIAHEINNPLWMISLQADVALSAKGKPEFESVVTECLQNIKQLVDRGGRIVSDTLRCAKGESTEKRIQSLEPSLRRACDFTRSRASTRQISYSWEIPENMPKVCINSVEIVQVLVNVLNNAIDASPAKSSIQLAAAWDALELRVTVTDRGRGIAAEEHQQVFDPFYSSRREHGGTGLGLSVAHRIMEDHDGRIDLVSQLGRGTAVSLCLPTVVKDNA